jgi:tRNA nucleotidyltransferase/poly(A) polymerase
MKTFKQFIENKRAINESEEKDREKNWKQEYVNLDPGFKPHSNMRPIIQAFLDSGSIELTNDTSKKVTMPKKSLYLVGGAVRDIVRGERPKDFDMATNATPEQIALILHNAGFKVPSKNDERGQPMPDYDRSGKHDASDLRKAKEMNISFKPSLQGEGDAKIWYLKGRDASSDNKPFVIGAVVNGEEFEIATFRKDAKTVQGQSEVHFVDNPLEDAERRDFTMNAMYIELSKADGENKRLYDPTKKGYSDANEGRVRSVGAASKRFEEDGLRVMRALRFHSKYGSEKSIDPELADAIPQFAELKGIALERVREEFLKGLDDKSIDPAKYVRNYARFGLLPKVFPGVSLRKQVPPALKNKRDRFLALAWILQDNPVDRVKSVLDAKRTNGDREYHTGWSSLERDTVCYLLKLKEFDDDRLDELLKSKKALGVTSDQIKRWVELFDVPLKGKIMSPRPMWSQKVKRFAEFEPDQRKLVSWHARDDSGKRSGEIHPEIARRGLDQVPSHFRSSVVRDINRERLRGMFDSQETR